MRTKFPMGTNNKAIVKRQVVALSQLVSRASLASAMGKTYGGQRDTYTALGYKKTLQFSDYAVRYLRQDIAKRIVDAPVDSTWRKKPEIKEKGEKDATAFDEAWEELVKAKRLWNKFIRVDKLAGIGRYAILVLGFDDDQELSQPVEGATELLYAQPYSEGSILITQYDEDVKSERFGKPLMYKITMLDTVTTSSSVTREAYTTRSGLGKEVHWTRVLHVADGALEQDVYGIPRLEDVYNRLENLEIVVGGAAEMFWRGAFPGLAFEADPEADIGDQDMSDLQEEIEEYIHGLRRYMRVQGVKVNSLTPQVADPKGTVEVILQMISAARGIPVRILTGSERGELASSQDESNWLSRIAERREDFAEAFVLRPFIDHLIDIGVLPDPVEGYEILWGDLLSLSEKEQAEVTKIKTEALATYTNAVGADLIIPPEVYLKRFFGFTNDEIEQMQEEIGIIFDRAKEEQDLINEEEEAARLERAGAPA
ncbi:hypothetical protein LCGC14_0775380 [marine sediment metagenome]|uniref:Anti-CBASS protein Acb1-like N-terminal domain-containing protein n=1 Tax=marine sediment metagenome TaxID=412755 RepID=A0A0F9T3Z7_9ZZZZ